MRVFFIAIGAAAATGAFAGWMAAGGGGNAARNDQTDWSLTEPPALGGEVQNALYSALMETNHFGAPIEALADTENTGEDDNSVLQIAGAWIIDGEISVGFHSVEGLVAAGVGDSLPGGWVVMDATLERVIIEREGESREITVFPYEKAGI